MSAAPRSPGWLAGERLFATGAYTEADARIWCRRGHKPPLSAAYKADVLAGRAAAEAAYVAKNGASGLAAIRALMGRRP